MTLTDHFGDLLEKGLRFLRLPITQKALQLPLFSSLSFSPYQIWTD